MNYETIDNVNYYLSSSEDFYFVGDNSTMKLLMESHPYHTAAKLLLETSSKEEKFLKLRSMRSISAKLKKVTIHAKIRIINACAFEYCTKLEYINIPPTVTFLTSLYLPDFLS